MTNFDRALRVLEAARRPGEHRIHPHDAVEALAKAGLLAPDLPEPDSAKLRKRIEERIRELKQPLCSYMPEGDELDDYLEQWEWQSYESEILTHILEGDDG
ncbi:hypothetical protein ACL1HL_00915 [Corynebacterium striatum]